MSFFKTSSLLAAALLVAKASAHGLVTGIVADGVYYPGYSPNFQYEQTPPVVAGWSIPEDQDTGFVSDYNSPDIVCHKGATPGGGYVTVAAGDTVKLEWTVWPESHHGPVMDYLASCNGDCTKVDKTALLFNKIDEGGLIDGSPPPGTWASDTLIANNNSWTVTIPPTIAPGKYVLRHEIIALHSADNLDGSQAYPQCVNLEITGSGTNTLSTGTVAQKFYKDTDPGIYVNIYYPALTNYTIPGPALIADAVSITQPTGGSAPVVSSAKPATTTSATTTTTTVPTGKIAAPTNIGGYPSLSPTLTSTTTSASATETKPSHFTAAPTASLSMSATSSFTFPGFPPFSKPTTSSSSTAAAPTFSKPTAPTFVRPTSSSSSATTSFTIPAYGFPSHPVAPASTSSSTTAVPTYTNWAAWESTPVAPLGTSSTSPVSFTSTVTGRIGRPTKFTCYIDED